MKIFNKRAVEMQLKCIENVMLNLVINKHDFVKHDSQPAVFN